MIRPEKADFQSSRQYTREFVKIKGRGITSEDSIRRGLNTTILEMSLEQ